MARLEISSCEGVTCAKTTIRVFGNSMDVYIYYFDGLLIDTGPVRASGLFLDFFDSKDIKKVILTHYHEDHSGNAFLLKRFGLDIHANSSSIKLLEKRPSLPLYRRVFWGVRPGIKAVELPDTFSISGNKVNVIDTPCHSRDHVCFFVPDKGVMFTGDVFISTKTKLFYKQENYYQLMRDIKKLLEYDFDTLFCSHAGAVPNGKKMLRDKLEFLEEEKEKILELRRKGLSIKKIDKALHYKDTKFISLVSNFEMSSRNMVKSVIEDE
ncbi:MBL fold metallo-hydrolase [Natranaerofaba carboxydovora]|uniref:MBL fold metallo-hydrolase n=1 Tax=Natranaerofaba carboxydovora TaxID=2742683 RepID=UPI001F12B943|nr:MBL fold metallo-hydrolase [Natranaerofaba carboxydovora]UMZ73777.1 Metallo-beta-lactamase superfamily protein [Natranaerofaba carboxydovora]